MKPIVPLLLGVAVLIAACGGGGSSHASTGSSAQSPTSTGTIGASIETTGPTSASSPSGAKPTTVKGTPTTSTGSSPTTGAASAPTLAGSTNRSGTNSAQPATPGLYKYRQSGTSTFGSTTKPIPTEGTLRIDPIRSDGDQVYHRTTDPSQPPSDTTFAFRNGGIFLVQIVTRSSQGGQQQTFTCNFNPPMASPPWPPSVGSTYGGSANCGGFTIDVKGKVTGTKDVVVSGASHHTFVLDSTLTFHGQIEGTGTDLEWADPATSLILHQETTNKATYSGFVTFSSKSTSDIESTRPS